MASPALIGGIAVLGAVGVYELYIKVIKPSQDQGQAPDVAPADTGSGTQTPAPAAATGKASPKASQPFPVRLGKVTDRWVAAHPEWAGWHPGSPIPSPKPRSHAGKLSLAAKVATKTPIINGKPVASGDVAKDLAALIAWHGVDPADKGVVARFQKQVGLKVDGVFGSQTYAALKTALAGKGIPMPVVKPKAPTSRPAPPSAPATPYIPVADSKASG